MAKALKARSFDDAVTWFRNHGFDVMDAPGTRGRIFLKKYNASAAIERGPDGAVKMFAYPGYLVGGEISKLVDKGYQKTLKTTKTEIAATAEHLKALHQFAEEYKYDRIRNRDLPENERPKRPWQKSASSKRPA